MADLGLVPAVENFHFKAFPDQFVGPMLHQATAQDTQTDQVELKVTSVCPDPSLGATE